MRADHENDDQRGGSTGLWHRLLPPVPRPPSPRAQRAIVGNLELRDAAGNNLGTWARTIHLKRLNGKWMLTEPERAGDGSGLPGNLLSHESPGHLPRSSNPDSR